MNALHTLTMGDDCPVGTVCFHAQQCAERYLQALLTLHEVPFPKTHDLLELLRLAPAGANLLSLLDGLSILNRYAIESRYPGDWEPITREDAEEAAAIAELLYVRESSGNRSACELPPLARQARGPHRLRRFLAVGRRPQ